MRLIGMLVVAGGYILSISCRQKPPAAPVRIAEPCAQSRHGFAISRYKIVRDSFARLIPGFAGLYRDGPQEFLHVNVTPEGDEDLARRVLLPYAHLIRHPKGAFVVVHRVEFSWLQLANWRCRIENASLRSVGLGIDEKGNVIRLYVPLESDTASLRETLASMQMPTRAVQITPTTRDTSRKL